MNIIHGGKILNTMDFEEKNVKYRPLKDEELKSLFEKFKLNTSFALPDRIAQDFINDGSIKPPFKKCIHFNKEDFNQMIYHLKKNKMIRKRPEKPRTKKGKGIVEINNDMKNNDINNDIDNEKKKKRKRKRKEKINKVETKKIKRKSL